MNPSPRRPACRRLSRLRATAAACCCSLLAAAAFAADPPAGPVEKVAVKAVARFDFDRTDVLPADQQTLLAEVAKMKDVTWQSVSARGYTDSVGSDAYNEKLSQRRADAVKRFLVGKGLEPGMIATEGLGPQSPVADNDSAAGRAQNRRTEVTFEGVRPTSVAGR